MPTDRPRTGNRPSVDDAPEADLRRRMIEDTRALLERHGMPSDDDERTRDAARALRRAAAAIPGVRQWAGTIAAEEAERARLWRDLARDPRRPSRCVIPWPMEEYVWEAVKDTRASHPLRLGPLEDDDA